MAEATNKFSFFESFYEAASELPDDQRLAFYDALTSYAFDGAEPELTGVLKVAWALAKPNIDSSIKRSKTNAENATKATAKTVAKTTAKATAKATVKTNPSMDMDKDMDRDKDRDMDMEANGNELSEAHSRFASASDGAAAAGASPPSANPHCPMCDSLLNFDVRSGRFKCPVCGDSFAPEKARFR